MSDMQKLIEMILSSKKRENTGDVAGKVYRDEPILITAAQMKNYTPPQYRQMRKIADRYRDAYDSDAQIFYEQGKFMETFEDEFDYQGTFFSYFPTYESMNDKQLRGYFSWRTKLRRGIVEKTFLSFAFVYIYELLNLIGVNSPLEGFYALKDFWKEYRELEHKIDFYVKDWLRDFAVYYDLDKTLLEETMEPEFEQALLILLHCDRHSAEEITTALNVSSSYNLKASRFYAKHPQDVETVTANVFRELSKNYGKNHKYGICEKLFGKATRYYYTMFRAAVFHQQRICESRVYEINEIHRYKCEGGHWICEKYMRNSVKNQQVGAILKNIDYYMRQKYNFKSTLKEAKNIKAINQVIQREIDQLIESQRKAATPKIEIDLRKLQAIRETAIKTQDKLIVADEEFFPAAVADAPVEEKPVGMSGATTTETTAAQEGTWSGTVAGDEAVQLDSIQRGFLRCLLEERPYGEMLKAGGLMLSVVVDAINESLYDTFGDTVILWDGERVELIEDYIDELKGIIAQ